MKLELSPSEVVEHHQVGVHVIEVVGIWWVLSAVPLLWVGAFASEDKIFWFGFIIHTVKASHLMMKGNKLVVDQQINCYWIIK